MEQHHNKGTRGEQRRSKLKEWEGMRFVKSELSVRSCPHHPEKKKKILAERPTTRTALVKQQVNGSRVVAVVG